MRHIVDFSHNLLASGESYKIKSYKKHNKAKYNKTREEMKENREKRDNVVF